jgi:hypothetical protein
MKINGKRKLGISIALAMVLSSLLFGQVFAHEIKVFAPVNYAGVPPSAPTPFMLWGSFATPGSFASIDPNEGLTVLNAAPNGINPGLAMSWFDTGWYNYTGPTQKGSVTSDTWLNYRIPSFGAGFFAYLWVFEKDPITGTFQYWTARAWDGMPASTLKNGTFDLGVIEQTPSNAGNQFIWTTSRLYFARVLLLSIAFPGTETTSDGKYDDLLWIGYTNSPQDHWDALNPQPLPPNHVQPVLGPNGTNVSVDVAGFAPNEMVKLYLDDQLVSQSPADGAGKYSIVFPLAGLPGIHVIRAVGDSGTEANSFFDIFVPASPLVGDVNGDGRIDMRDIVSILQNFNRMDPNKPNMPGAAQQTVAGLSAVALGAIFALGIFRRRKKNTSKTSTS